MKKNMKYEEAFSELEKLTEILEKGDLPLEETVKVYDEATKLFGYCTALLDNAKLKITQLSQDGDKNE